MAKRNKGKFYSLCHYYYYIMCVDDKLFASVDAHFYQITN